MGKPDKPGALPFDSSSFVKSVVQRASFAIGGEERRIAHGKPGKWTQQMVFYDRSGFRKHLVIGIFCTILLGAGVYAAIAYFALAHAVAPGTFAYENQEADPRFEKTIALTFDDGPHPEYTREVMALLKQENVPATFFLIGSNVVKHPEVAREIVESGFEIGNHTFTHSEHMADSEARLRRELVSTDQVIRDATGRHAILFRPPFLEDVDVGEFDGGRLESTEVRWAEEMGYVVVGANLDTRDWNVSEGDSETVSARLYERLPTDNRPVVIIMHEHAGAGATIDALRTFIPEMRARGYRFVHVSEYFGLTPAETMPVSEASGLWNAALVSAAKLFVLGGVVLAAIVGIISVLGIVRMWMIVALRKTYVPFTRRSQGTFEGVRTPLSILIPAYNEAANIEATVRSVLAAASPRDEIIIIDDGSTDNTNAIVRMLCARHSQIILMSKTNGGTKGAALQYALPHAAHEIVVCIDADTIVARDSLDLLVPYFDDPLVAAVAGKIYPTRVHSVLSTFQYLEYMQGQNLDKEVMQLGNAIGVVPGALGAWRKSALVRVDGYSPDTVVEDQDLTIALLAAGYRVHFEPNAKAYTETPDTLGSFFRQRSRWVFGTVQCAWKYRDQLFSVRRPALGWIVLPNLVFFNLFIPLLVPIVDGAVIAGLFGWINIWMVIGPFIIFTLFDMWCALEALAYEKRPVARLVPLVLWQRFFYRYIMAAAIAKSFGRALAGSFVGWGTQTRRGECHT
ncbi:MAG: bifunctional polysaccharide deacetylase/glycosyltransferase family 2 protein, partial [Minisyncoccia bacterium]